MENKNINSIFEEPESFIYQLVLGIGSFSVMLFVFVEHGFKIFGFEDSSFSFYIFVLLYFGIPAFLPFYNLILSGRNLPKQYVFFAFPPLFIITFILYPFYAITFIFAGLVLLWIAFFILMFLKGKVLRSSEDKQVFIKENAIMEIGLLIVILLFGIAIRVYSGISSIKNEDISNTFKTYDNGKQILENIEENKASIKIQKQILNDIKENKDLEKFTTQVNNLLATINAFKLDSKEIKQKSESLWLNSNLFLIKEEAFASSFEKVLKSYQQKGVILLLISAIMLLFLWVNTVEKEEISNRIKTHFFIILALIVPLFRSYDKKDITIDKPFGFSFTNGDDNDENKKIPISPQKPPKPPVDTSEGTKYVLITQEQLDQLAKESSVQSLKNEIPKTTYNHLIDLYNTTIYRNKQMSDVTKGGSETNKTKLEKLK